jgi:hypothetical protein
MWHWKRMMSYLTVSWEFHTFHLNVPKLPEVGTENGNCFGCTFLLLQLVFVWDSIFFH